MAGELKRVPTFIGNSRHERWIRPMCISRLDRPLTLADSPAGRAALHGDYSTLQATLQ